MPGPPANPESGRSATSARKAEVQTFAPNAEQVKHGRALIRFDVAFKPSDKMGTSWNALTKEWYDKMRVSPFAHTYTDLDWMYLIDTAIIHHMFMMTKSSRYFMEFRQRVGQFGVTPAERQRLRWVVDEYEHVLEEPNQVEATNKAEDELANRRQRILKGEANG